MITVASEIMAILCLSLNLMDLKKRMDKILVAYNLEGGPVYCENLKVNGAMALKLGDYVVTETSWWSKKGADGGRELADKVLDILENETSNFKLLYDDKLTIKEKTHTIASEIYGADGVEYSPSANKQISEIEKLGLDKVPICVAKTQNSLSDNPSLLVRPINFKINIKEVKILNGAGFVVALTGNIMTIPGLPKVPAANKMDIFEDGTISGLF
jgi:formate--tetrahydrofolate ligase